MSESERLKAFQDSSRIHSPESGFLAQKSYVPPLYTNLHCLPTKKRIPLYSHYFRVDSFIWTAYHADEIAVVDANHAAVQHDPAKARPNLCQCRSDASSSLIRCRSGYEESFGKIIQSIINLRECRAPPDSRGIKFCITATAI